MDESQVARDDHVAAPDADAVPKAAELATAIVFSATAEVIPGGAK